jgi:hypothetical protein
MLAVALLGAVAVGVFRADLDERLAAMHVPQRLRTELRAEASKLTEAKAPQVREDRLREQLTGALRESSVGTFRMVMLFASGAALLGAICGWLMIRPRTART